MPKPVDREKLLRQREDLETQIKALKASPVGRSQTAINGRQEDLLNLAKQMVSIDRKLGRIQ